MTDTLRAGGVPHLKTYASAAIALCQAAGASGADLAGARFTLTGEPLTAVRQSALEKAGVEARPDYRGDRDGQVGEAYVSPVAPDDLHAMEDIHVIVQPGVDGASRDPSERSLPLFAPPDGTALLPERLAR